MSGTIKLIHFSILGKFIEKGIFRLVVRLYVLNGQKYGEGD